MGEFNLSYDYLYTMTMAEFNIRHFALNRMEENKDIRTREIAYNALIAPHSDPKKLPKNKVQYWKIGDDKKVSIDKTEFMKKVIEKAVNKYNNRK